MNCKFRKTLTTILIFIIISLYPLNCYSTNSYNPNNPPKELTKTADDFLEQFGWERQDNNWTYVYLDDIVGTNIFFDNINKTSQKMGLKGIKASNENIVYLTSQQYLKGNWIFPYYISYTIIIDGSNNNILNAFIDVIPANFRPNNSESEYFNIEPLGIIKVTEPLPINTKIKDIYSLVDNYDSEWIAASLNYLKQKRIPFFTYRTTPNIYNISSEKNKWLKDIFQSSGWHYDDFQFYCHILPLITQDKDSFFSAKEQKEIINLSIKEGYQDTKEINYDGMNKPFYFSEKPLDIKNPDKKAYILFCAQISFPTEAYYLSSANRERKLPFQCELQTAFIAVTIYDHEDNELKRIIYPIETGLSQIIKDLKYE